MSGSVPSLPLVLAFFRVGLPSSGWLRLAGGGKTLQPDALPPGRTTDDSRQPLHSCAILPSPRYDALYSTTRMHTTYRSPPMHTDNHYYYRVLALLVQLLMRLFTVVGPSSGGTSEASAGGAR